MAMDARRFVGGECEQPARQPANEDGGAVRARLGQLLLQQVSARLRARGVHATESKDGDGDLAEKGDEGGETDEGLRGAKSDSETALRQREGCREYSCARLRGPHGEERL